MEKEHVALIAQSLSVSPRQVKETAELLGGGATVPFIARYRKELTGGLDEVQVIAIRDELARLAELDRRRARILTSLSQRSLLTPELKRAVDSAPVLSQLEDIYLPFREKRKTRATMAREKGLQALTDCITAGACSDPTEAARAFVNPEEGVVTVVDALSGARDIVAERVNEDARTRGALRTLFQERSVITSAMVKKKASEEGAERYRDYFEWSEPVGRVRSHRILAILRGAREGFLRFKVRPEEDQAVTLLHSRHLDKALPALCRQQVEMAIADAYTRLLCPSMENEMLGKLKEQADRAAVEVFTRNVRDLLLSPPFGQRPILAVDPGFRTGCKVVSLDAHGRLLENTTLFPLPPQEQRDKAVSAIKNLVQKYKPEAIAVGNGTGGREMAEFLREIKADGMPPVISVDESGASVYSASEAGREEFPDYDLTVRGAVSIGRRLQDPLAELVKIDPQAIGVGQYQHDVDQNMLSAALSDVVVSCVNSVGVELNSASEKLLSYVSGLSRKLAQQIAAHRDRLGGFTSRKDLQKVRGVGEATFQLAAGFLRVGGGKNPLDRTGVHPERYTLVEQIARDAGMSIEELIGNKGALGTLDLSSYAGEDVGLPTLRDIVSELLQPGRDPRDTFEAVEFDPKIRSIEDLKPGMVLHGVVTNVTDFGAFVDLGVHDTGLVHVSNMADRYVSDPREIVHVHQPVTVTVLDVDQKRRRISLSMTG